MLEETSILVPLTWETQKLAMIDDTSLKIQDIRFKLAALDSIHLTLQVNVNACSFHWKMKWNTIVFSRNTIRPVHEILAINVRIRSKLVLLDSFRLALQVYTESMYLSLKYQVLYRKNLDFRDNRLLNRTKVQICKKLFEYAE